MHDQIDQAVFLQKLRGLETFRQILMRRFLDHARAGETDHASGLGDDDVA